MQCIISDILIPILALFNGVPLFLRRGGDDGRAIIYICQTYAVFKRTCPDVGKPVGDSNTFQAFAAVEGKLINIGYPRLHSNAFKRGAIFESALFNNGNK